MEEWVDIKGWEGYYQISPTGKIKSLQRAGVMECIRKASIQNSGYYVVSLYRNNKGYGFLVHRLLGLTFVPNPKPRKYKFINHKNGIKTDNRIENLEWCTKGYNQRHAYKHGFKKVTEKHLSRLIHWNKTEHGIKISQFTKEGRYIASFESMAQASASTGLNYSAIVDCVKGRHKSCGGFIFKKIT